MHVPIDVSFAEMFIPCSNYARPSTVMITYSHHGIRVCNRILVVSGRAVVFLSLLLEEGFSS